MKPQRQEVLLFELGDGDAVFLSPEMISDQLAASGAQGVDAEFVRQAARAVFHYFKHELGLKSTSLDQFATTVEKVLGGFTHSPVPAQTRNKHGATDLGRLAEETGCGGELAFFARLREELRRQLRRADPVLKFCGLRRCVMRLAGSRPWSPSSDNLETQIVDN